jgi:hypothetical protein
MVRRDGTGRRAVYAAMRPGPCCKSLAGESPVPVSAGAPGSRAQQRGEIFAAERAVESLCGGSNEAGRNQVNAEQASSDFQPKGVWEGRAGHVAAKTTDSAPEDPEGVLDLPGVLAAARFEREMRNTRDPTQRPALGKDRTYKARAESGRSWEGVRGAHSTREGGDKPLEGRGPILVTLGLRVSARACL